MMRSTRRAAARACTVWFVLASGHVALATEDDVASLLRTGIALRREHRNEEALRAFQRANELAPAPRVLAQIALAEQALGRWLEAARDLDSALNEDADPWIVKNRHELEESRAAIDSHIAWLQVDVDPGATIALDGRPLRAHIEERVLSGECTLQVRAPERIAETSRLTLAPQSHTHLSIALAADAPASPTVLVPAAPPARTAVPEAARGASPSLVGPLVLIGVGAAGIVAGSYFGIRTINEKSDRDAACASGPPCPAASADHDAAARSSATASTVSFTAGVVFAAAGAGWWIVRSHSASRAAPQVRLVPHTDFRSATFMFEGSL